MRPHQVDVFGVEGVVSYSGERDDDDYGDGGGENGGHERVSQCLDNQHTLFIIALVQFPHPTLSFHHVEAD